ncbi:MAG TPA: hypothetical protein DCM08_02535 [Microscillaceae bacterium]|nr:hypothetical protein [Microscillaceae bacterium]
MAIFYYYKYFVPLFPSKKYFVGLLLLCLWLGSRGLSAQESVLDSLQHLENKLSGKPSQQLVDVYNQLSYHWRNSESAKSLSFANKAYELAQKLEYQPGLAKSLLNQGNYYRYKSQYTQALTDYEKALMIYQKIDIKKGLIEAKNYIGITLTRQNRSQEAFTTYTEALQLAESTQDLDMQAQIQNNIGLMYQDRKQYQEALAYFEKSLQYFSKQKDDRSAAYVLNNIGMVYEQQKQLDKALSFYSQSLVIGQRTNDKRATASTMVNIGDVYRKQNRLQEAKETYDQCLDWHQKVGNEEGITSIKFKIASIEAAQGNLPQAESALLEVLEISQSRAFLELQRDINKELSLIYEQKKDFDKALRYYKQFTNLDDSLVNIQNSVQVLELQTRFETEKKTKENTQLRQKNAIEERNFWILLTGVACLLSLVAIGGFWYVKQAQNQQASQNKIIQSQHDDIVKSNEKLAAQNNLLNQLAEEKDSAIRLITHDLKAPFDRIRGLARLLELEMNGLEESQKDLIQRIVHNAQDGTNTVLRLLDLKALESNKISFSIEQVDIIEPIQKIMDAYRIQAQTKAITLHFQTTNKPIWLETDVFYFERIIDNLLSNAIKFSPSQKNVYINVSHLTELGQALVSIQDEGPGFTDEDSAKVFQPYQRLSNLPTGSETSTGVGLSIVKNLVEKLGGSIRFETIPAQGTTFFVQFPLVKS